MKRVDALTSPEITGLWQTYMQNSAMLCFLEYFQHHMEDEEIMPVLKGAVSFSKKCLDEIKEIFNSEKFPIPKGFSRKDVDFEAPRLYNDLFALSFIYRMHQMAVSFYGTTLTKVARNDIVTLFAGYLSDSTNLYLEALNLMLSKGIYDRPPKMPYPDESEMMPEQPSAIETLIGEKRALNAAELGEIFYIIERNYIGLILLTGFIQVMKDAELKRYFLKGKKLAEKQIEIFNDILKKEEEIGNIPVSMEVTGSTISPFSDKLMTFTISTTTSTGIFLIGYALSISFRKDLAVHYSLLMAEIMKFGSDGLKLMTKRGWLEQLPQGINRKRLMRE
ncbi:DUF3231 family protein [Falsibacillus pallidus]|uniref:Uncharacterized protein DUF3231 n=1 Tax=Falsibacillus pallidus TaxID=493781 RepID=A0A370GQG3_9BACI|nr:DUF3231 family protein [Falsibacillus pallidus]RDI45917.1 uncharacterized protein DUF3231 [Falsibacillus pallidus]